MDCGSKKKKTDRRVLPNVEQTVVPGFFLLGSRKIYFIREVVCLFDNALDRCLLRNTRKHVYRDNCLGAGGGAPASL